MRQRFAFVTSDFFVLVALVVFILAECSAQGWLTVGTFAEWIAGGFIALTLAIWE